MEDKRYLKWYHKIGYGSGDIAGNVVYALLTHFVMFYLTSIIGMNIGIVGTLIAISKVFDGVTDVFFGSMIDKTKSKLGKARPWMIYGYAGCAVSLAAIFMVPQSWGTTAQYAYFFIAYNLLNAVFYTANNIAYSALTALITKNGAERVQLGSIRFMFAYGTSMLIQAVTVGLVEAMGGGAAGWRNMAIIYAIIGLIINTISGLSVKELPEEEADNSVVETADVRYQEEKYTMGQAAKLLLANKYYLLICGVYILAQIYSAMLGMGLYYMTYIMGNAELLGSFSVALNAPVIAGLLLTPILVQKMGGMYKLNMIGYVIGTLGRGLVIVAAYMGNLPLMLLATAVGAIGISPLQGDLNALIAECSEYTFLSKNKRIDGTMYSCSSLGTKIGGGLGTAICGWMLAAAGFVEKAAVQPQGAMNMLQVLYLWMPMILNFVILILLSKLKVEQTNARLRAGRVA